jgi:hypothetical protein
LLKSYIRRYTSVGKKPGGSIGVVTWARGGCGLVGAGTGACRGRGSVGAVTRTPTRAYRGYSSVGAVTRA